MKKTLNIVKKSVFVVLFLIILIGIACTPKITSNLIEKDLDPIPEDAEIYILQEEDDEIYYNLKFVGELKIGDSGFSTKCGYDIVLEKARLTARKSGANIIRITEIKKPGFASSCYRIKGKMYRSMDEQALNSISALYEETNKSRLPADADYAVVYFYRIKSSQGALIGYKIRNEEDEIIGRVRNGEKFEYRTKEFGPYEFTAKTENPTKITIDIEQGQEYFVSCGIKPGVLVGMPTLSLIENSLGMKEYESIEVKEKK